MKLFLIPLFVLCNITIIYSYNECCEYKSSDDLVTHIQKYKDSSCRVEHTQRGTIFIDKYCYEDGHFNGAIVETTKNEFLHFIDNNFYPIKSDVLMLADTNKYIFDKQIFVINVNNSYMFDSSLTDFNNLITIIENRLYYLYLHIRGEISEELLKYVTNHTYGIYVNGQEVISCQIAVTPYTTNDSYDIVENNNKENITENIENNTKNRGKVTNTNSTLHFLPCNGITILNLKNNDKVYFGLHLMNEIPNKLTPIYGLYNYWGISEY